MTKLIVETDVIINDKQIQVKDVMNKLLVNDSSDEQDIEVIFYDEDDVLKAHNMEVIKELKTGKYILRCYKFNDNYKTLTETIFNSLKDIKDYLEHTCNIPIESLREKSRLTFPIKKIVKNYQGIKINLYFICFRDKKGKRQIMVKSRCMLDQKDMGIYQEFSNILKKTLSFGDALRESWKSYYEKDDKIQIVHNPFAKPHDMAKYYDNLKRYYQENPKLLEELTRLQLEKEEIIDLHRKHGSLPVPVVITVSGTPRAGKTTCIDNLFEYFKKAGLKTKCLAEPAGLVYETLKSKEEKQELLKDRVGFVEKQYEIGKQYIDQNLKDNDIILCDRGILDTFIWYDMYYHLGMITKDRYEAFLTKLNEPRKYYSMLCLLYASCKTSMLRDYQSSLSIEPRSTMNEENVKRYNRAMLRIVSKFYESTDENVLINTSSLARMDASVKVASLVLKRVKKIYKEG